METALLKSFAIWARRELIGEVQARILAVLAEGSYERREHPQAIIRLERALEAEGDGEKGRQSVADQVAYTWFNRIIALRFMDALGYTGVGVVSPSSGQAFGQPEILANAKGGSIDSQAVSEPVTRTVHALLDGQRPSQDPQGEAYALLLKEYCRHWHQTLPFMFGKDTSYTDLLVPPNLLVDDSILARAWEVLTHDVCQEVEAIGWLYQFYISERKDEVFAGFKKNQKAGAAEIPAATQLFTPHWIVRYLVENSVGRLWMLNHPGSQLVDQMDYYITPVEEEADFLKISSPEELKVIDPACGSGHMLTYAFDVLYAIYEEEGYAPSEIPSLILTYNLHGTEIDPRAGALAAFALTMKALAKQRRFLSKGVQPNICVLEPIHFTSEEVSFLLTSQAAQDKEIEFWAQFENADTFGSLIRPDAVLTARLSAHLESIDGDDLFAGNVLGRAEKVIQQSAVLSRQYSVVVANPPYMGSKQMNGLLSQFMKDEYPEAKSDLFAGFISRCTNLAGPRGALAMITMQSWMFLSSYEKLRSSLLTKQRITSMLHLGARAFDSIGGEVVSSTAFVVTNVPLEVRGAASKRPGTFIRLVDGTSEAEKVAALSTALEVRAKEAGFHLASDADFTAIPGFPIVYWLSEKMRAAFARGVPLSVVAPPKNGLSTSDDAAFTRAWWEVSQTRSEFDRDWQETGSGAPARWFPLDKGGEFRRWYGNLTFLVNWENHGEEIKRFILRRYPYLNGNPGIKVRSTELYFKPHLSFSSVSSGAPAFREYPTGTVFGGSAKAMFIEPEVRMRELLSILNSRLIAVMLEAIAPTLNFEAGQLAGLPIVPEGDDRRADRVDSLIGTSKSDWDSCETSWDFERNPLVARAWPPSVK